MTTKELQLKGTSLDLDGVKELLSKIEVPYGRTGIFDVKINNHGKKYHFEELKETFSGVDSFGFSLNHYGWMGLKKQKYKRSKFHNEEDVAIHVDREEFKSAYVYDNFLLVITKTFKMVVTW